MAVKADRNQTNRNDRFAAFTADKGRDFVFTDVVAAQKVRADHEKTEMTFGDGSQDSRMPFLANHDLAVDPKLEFVVFGRLKLRAQSFHHGFSQRLVLMRIGNEKAHDSLPGRHRAAGGGDAFGGDERPPGDVRRDLLGKASGPQDGGVRAGEPHGSLAGRAFLFRIDLKPQTEVGFGLRVAIRRVVQALPQPGEVGEGGLRVLAGKKLVEGV